MVLQSGEEKVEDGGSSVKTLLVLDVPYHVELNQRRVETGSGVESVCT